MRKPIFLIVLIATLRIYAMDLGGYSLRLTEIKHADFPGLHSYVGGEYNGEWLLIGGRTDGLHRRQPWAAFLSSDNNTNIYVINPISGELWFAPLPENPPAVFEQLQSTNMQFAQYGETLYVTGGYGYSATEGDHITFPYLTRIEVPRLIDSVKAGKVDLEAITQTEDERVRVTGGQLRRIGNTFYLVGGNLFMGQYRPMAGGRGFIQEYTNQIRSFAIGDTDGKPVITRYEAVTDQAELHRRDYNLVTQIFPGGEIGLTAFSGVFQYAADLPWLNTVDIFPDRYVPVDGFSQYLNQYHTANMPVYDAVTETMYTVFFGGIGRYTLNSDGHLIDDPEVPFVKTISMVARTGDGAMQEVKAGTMPGFLGTAAEFFPCHEPDFNEYNIMILGEDRPDSIKAGYIFGGIESTASNIFNINDGTLSRASNRLFLVELIKSTDGKDN